MRTKLSQKRCDLYLLSIILMFSSFSFLRTCAAAIGFFTFLCTLLFLLYKKFRFNPQNETTASSSTPSSAPSSSSQRWNYHVFLSFSSVDVPISFRRRISKELRRKGFDPFIDDEIERSVSIGPELVKAIRGSRIVLVMLSRNYASSSWSLNELVEIMNCKEEMGQRVVTFFYELDPVDVKAQTGDFGKNFNKTCKGKTKEDIEKWRQALEEVATIVDYHSSDWDNETAMIEKIATDISKKLNNTTRSSGFECLVGMEPHIEEMEHLLCLDSDEVRMIGIWGPPGIGKTTIARVLFSKYSHQFQHSVFMENIRARERTWHDEYNTKLQLQNLLLSQLLNENYTDEILHLRVAQKKLKDNKMLVVFDDVDSLGQLDALAIETLWFGPGSRIIITSQEPRLLKAHGIKHLYKVGIPPLDEALQIFSVYVHAQKFPRYGFNETYQELTTLCGQHPLGLRLLGVCLRGRGRGNWQVPRLRTSLDGEIGSIIKFTYNYLWGEEKELSHHHISYLGDDELTEIMEEYLTKGFSEVRRGKGNAKQDLKEDLYASERSFEGISNGILHSIDIYCADTLQYSFASQLSLDFRRKGIYAFVNSNETLDVIEGASASVVVFSNSCFTSTSCLDTLVRVLQCQRKPSQLVVPVFYGISPSDVVLQKHESADRIREWSIALQKLRELPGYQFREGYSECGLVEAIVKDVYEKLFPTEQIGINSRLLEIEQLLCKQPWGIRRIGIWGMPGIGKTTLAKAVFNQISGGYEASCLIKHFDKAFHEQGLQRLLEEHFGKILKELPRVCSSITRPSLPGDRLSKKRTLVVLDDVYNPLVAEFFLGGFHWFGPGSLIIITSRDKQVFRLCQIDHVYEVHSLNEDEALQLFSQCVFGEDIREQNMRELSMQVVDYTNGNPLALKFYGGELKGKKLSEMETTFLKLKLRTPYKIRSLFKSSYETLDDNEKNIFLDIACFFKGEDVDYVMQLLEGCGFFPHDGIDVLVDKCLVTISENRVKMHRIIQDFGREIINGETVQIERRRRLWEPWTIKFLLEDDKLEANGYPKATCQRALGTEDIEGIFLDTSNLLFDVKPTAFDNMLNLRFLKLYCSNHENQYGLRLPRGLESLPYELRLLHWENYPLQSLPQDFDPCHLVELNMSHSRLQKLWGGTKNLEMLKTFKLCHSQQLTEIEDLCRAPNIELIDLQGCTKLQRFPATSQLQHLRVVNLSGCTEITSFPEVSPNIEELHLQGTGIRELPISIVNHLFRQDKLNRELSNLLTEFSGVANALNLEKLTGLVQVVSSYRHLGKLVFLNMRDCYHLQSLPHMVDLESLEVLDLSGCSELKSIQGFPRNLKELYLVGTAVKELPPLPSSIELLNAHGCVSLISIPFGFERLPRYYTFSNCIALSAQVVSEFVKNALTNVGRIARDNQPELNKSLAFSFAVPSPASKKFTCDLQPGSSVMIQLDSSWRSTLGFAILVELSFLKDFHEASGFSISCVCRWKDKEFISHSLERSFHCWTPGEGVPKDYMFVFGDLNMPPSICEGNDPSILADLVVFEFFTVDKQEKLLDESCTVTKCGVHVFTAANGDASSSMTQPFSSRDDWRANVAEEVLRFNYNGLEENDKNLFLYIASLFSDKKSAFLAPLRASIGLGISSRLKLLANKFLIDRTPYGIIVRHGLLEKLASTNHHSNRTEFSSSTATTTATSSSSVERQSQFSEAVSESSGGTMSNSGLLLESPNLKVYSFLDLKTATKNFNPDSMLGEGLYGKVYKGWIDVKTLAPSKAGSGMIVAVKRLNSEVAQRLAEWRSEVNFLGMLSHPNLVKLLGYCREGEELLLVYEFMPGGSLENHLFRQNEPFPWDLRMKIVIGAAHGLAFLHSSQREVIYRDFKASNILLDSNYDAKLSDFGLAKLGPSNEKSHVTTRIMGTHGYAAPEYMATGHLYVKSDVYAFGVVLLEVMTGQRAHNPKRPYGQENLVDWLRPELSSKHKVKRLMDKGIEGQYTTKVATEMARITLSCVEPDPKNRPHMKDVLDVLEHIQQINVPSRFSTKPAVASSSHSSPRHRYGYRAGAAGAERRRQSPGRFGADKDMNG